MKLNGFEKKVLDKMHQSLVANKFELFEAAKAKTKKDKTEVERAIRSLINKDMIVPVYSSHTTFALTQNGSRASKK